MVCTRINYETVPITSLKKYLHSVTSGTENRYRNVVANDGSEKL